MGTAIAGRHLFRRADLRVGLLLSGAHGGAPSTLRASKSVLASVHALRKRCKTLADTPPEAIAHLDAIIVILKTV
jgi:hypothetical protein